MVDTAGGARYLSLVLFLVLAVSVAGVMYVAVNPPPATEAYTEFYVLGPGGNATEYPSNLSVGETGTVIVGTTNHEHQSTDYTVEMRLDDRLVQERQLSLGTGETWEAKLSFTAREPGERQLRLQLFRDGETGVYRTLRVRVNVSA